MDKVSFQRKQQHGMNRSVRAQTCNLLITIVPTTSLCLLYISVTSWKFEQNTERRLSGIAETVGPEVPACPGYSKWRSELHSTTVLLMAKFEYGFSKNIEEFLGFFIIFEIYKQVLFLYWNCCKAIHFLPSLMVTQW